ncbi:uncharacterized protein V1510DRAFT_417537 [Dipodascopsis tothii]|uniref:uncharacterized protein n=1 Tax=Dipodascopsis tothii TaxID=44089 RepID=UPI0034CF15C2
MDQTAPDVTELASQISQLETKLAAILDGGINEHTSSQDAIERAKTCTVLLYSLTSMLFSALKVSGADTTNHPVMTDIRRVQDYMAKIKNAEEVAAGRTTTVNKEAADRVVKHALNKHTRFS